jgi:hypothetical protein
MYSAGCYSARPRTQRAFSSSTAFSCGLSNARSRVCVDAAEKTSQVPREHDGSITGPNGRSERLPQNGAWHWNSLAFSSHQLDQMMSAEPQADRRRQSRMPLSRGPSNCHCQATSPVRIAGKTSLRLTRILCGESAQTVRVQDSALHHAGRSRPCPRHALQKAPGDPKSAQGSSLGTHREV